jgi:mitogen-activated protein kinase 1/3
LKPSNILVDKKCNVKICDFGLARGVQDEEELTEYVVTRWYRAPEVVLDAKHYGAPLDMWSVGCIMAEMYTRRPLFKGEDYADQLKKIFNVIGSPSDDDIRECVTDEGAVRFLGSLARKPSQDLSKVLKNASADAVDLISKLLTFSPNKRIEIDEALNHPFLKKFYDEDFVKSSIATREFDQSYERHLRNKDDIRRIMVDEIRVYRPYAVMPDTHTKNAVTKKAAEIKKSSLFKGCSGH